MGGAQKGGINSRNMSHTPTHADIRVSQGAKGYILHSGAFKNVCPTYTTDAGLIWGNLEETSLFLCAYKILVEPFCFVSSGILLS